MCEIVLLDRNYKPTSVVADMPVDRFAVTPKTQAFKDRAKIFFKNFCKLDSTIDVGAKDHTGKSLGDLVFQLKDKRVQYFYAREEG
jgi:hypothetical protein